MLDIIDRAWRQLVASTLTDEELCNELVKVAMRNGESRRAAERMVTVYMDEDSD